jgi:hypothetical protein
MPLSREQFTQDVDYSHGSVRNQIVHVISQKKRRLNARLRLNSEVRAYRDQAGRIETRFLQSNLELLCNWYL